MQTAHIPPILCNTVGGRQIPQWCVSVGASHTLAPGAARWWNSQVGLAKGCDSQQLHSLSSPPRINQGGNDQSKGKWYHCLTPLTPWLRGGGEILRRNQTAKRGCFRREKFRGKCQPGLNRLSYGLYWSQSEGVLGGLFFPVLSRQGMINACVLTAHYHLSHYLPPILVIVAAHPGLSVFGFQADCVNGSSKSHSQSCRQACDTSLWVCYISRMDSIGHIAAFQGVLFICQDKWTTVIEPRDIQAVVSETLNSVTGDLQKGWWPCLPHYA